MTEPLRETLAKALYDNSTEIVSGDGARQAAAAVLRALATWEPGDRLVEGLAEMRFTATGIDWKKHIKDVIAAALRAMAEEGT